MAESDLLFYKDAQFQLELDPVGAAGVFTTLCGVTNASLAGSNEIISFKDGNCTDPEAAIETIKNYGAGDASMSVDFNTYKSVLPIILDWHTNQKRLSGRINMPNAVTGEVSTIDGVYLLESWSQDGIGNLDGNALNGSLSLQISGAIVPTLVP